MKITLSLWDIGGQERFDFFKTDFFKGTGAVGLVFDLSRPDTFEKINVYIDEIRERSGNIPLVLVGNKSDLTKTLGETIPKGDIIQKVNRDNLVDYIETSALENINIEKLFNLLGFSALLDLRPRLGEIVDSDHFRFKVLLVGDASVGKSSLIKKFIEKEFTNNYKLTIGLDLLVKDIEISEEDIPAQAIEIIKTAISNEKRRLRQIRKLEKISKIIAEETGNPEIATGETLPDDKIIKLYKKKKKKKVFYFSLGILSVFLIIILLIIWLF
ncbi:MAG: hypothetical protein EU532_11445 [Promethearchaeota archaeon]|nr:MAG: hypothetical protein EU532_11445 [Candidatus Lokiarchaeota archaeon]